MKQHSIFILLALSSLSAILAEQCGSQAGNALCPNGLCCSKFGWCGSTDEYCKDGCQSQCNGATPTPSNPTPVPSTDGDISSVINSALFDQMLKHSKDTVCSNGFYTYNAFIAAARSFNGFGTTGDADTRKREVAAFLGQTSHETTGGWPDAPDGPYAWGYCFITERGPPPGDFCTSTDWPCAPGKRYYGRGPIQLTHNYNYGQAGQAIQADLINNPDLVATDAVLSFKTAIWFWMTAQANKPSSHDVITGRWTPSSDDSAAGRVPGYGVITNIINGGKECGKGPDDKEAARNVADRIGFYKRYCDMFGVGYGNYLDCYNQRSFAPPN